MTAAESRPCQISIIIPHWNGISVLSECLDSLLGDVPEDTEIIVVDNHSTDGSPQYLKERYPQVRLVENRENRGYAGGCNDGAAVASGRYYLFLNNDTIHRPGWIQTLVAALEAEPDVAAVQPKILNYYQRDLFDYAGGSGGELDLFVYPFARGRIFQSQERDEGQYDDPVDIFWASGTALMVRAECFREVGRFDESFFAHMEEIDLCWKFHLQGKRVKIIPSAVIYHRNAVTLTMYSFRKYYLNHRNSLMLLLTNYNLPLTLYLFPLRFVLEWVALGYALVYRDWNHVRGICAALGWLIFHPGDIVRRRRFVRSVRTVKDRQLVRSLYRGSIVVAYYVLRKKSYRALGLGSPR
ncbi:MAG: glycosyltransferase family 2 protein [Candidatus Neomarinimicrobiota bacterium]|nr:MAG: glycosyltransferase family 2 protein [Candidatus Neomarinimicrobiota bacterium]